MTEGNTQLRVLGPFEVTRDGEAVLFPPSNKARVLLTYLALTRRSHLRSRLCELFWDVADDPRGELRWCLSKLRRAVDGATHPAIVADRREVSLDARACWTDAVAVRARLVGGASALELEELRELAGYFRGELLEGVDFPELYAAQAWLASQRSEARKLHGVVLDELIARLGDEPGEALPHARRLVSLRPRQGEPRATLYRLLIALGDHTEAEQQLQIGLRELEELGASSHALRVAKRDAAPRRDAAVERARVASATGSTVQAGSRDPIPFVGRARELALLDAALSEAIAGAGCLRTLRGEAGVGKSRLVQELVETARRRGLAVLQGGCVNTAGAPPYLPFIEALDGPVAGIDDARLEPERAILSRILPTVANLVTSPDRGPLGAGERIGDDRYAVFRAAATVLGALAEPGGLLLVLEDLHWADAQSLLMLAHLVRQLRDAKVMIVATSRDVPALDETLSTLRREPNYADVKLGCLAKSDAELLVGDLISDAAAGAAIVARAGGLPLFIVELSNHLSEDGADPGGELPPRVLDVLGHRISRLSEGCRRMLTCASALTGAARWPVLAAVVAGDEDELLDHLDEALAAKIIRERPSTRSGIYEFTHALIRQALYGELSVPRRARLHRRIAAALERLGADDPVDLAYHHGEGAGGGSLDVFVSYTIRAGERAMELFAYEDAAALYLRALERLGERDDEAARRHRAALYRQRGVALSSLAAWEEAHEAFLRGLSALPPGSDVERARLLVHSAQAQLWLMNIPALIEDASEARELAVRAGHDETATAASGLLTVSRSSAGEVDEAVGEFERLLAKTPKLSDPLVAQTVTNLYPQILYWTGRYEQLLAFKAEIAPLALHSTVQMMLMPLLGLAYGAVGRYREASEVFATSHHFGRDHNVRNLLARSVAMSVGNLIDTLHFDEARARAHEALELARSLEFPPTVVSAQIDLCDIAMSRRELGLVHATLPRMEEAAAQMAGWHQWIFALRLALTRARLAYLEGDLEAALEGVNTGIERARRASRPKYTASGLALRGVIQISRGHEGPGVEDLREATALARAMSYAALIVRFGSALSAWEESDELAREVQDATATITAELDGPGRELYLAELANS